MEDYSKLCNEPTDIFGNKFLNSNNLIIIKSFFDKFLCFTRNELKNIIINPLVIDSDDGNILKQRKDNKEFFYMLPYPIYYIDNSLLRLFNDKKNTMELVENEEYKNITLRGSGIWKIANKIYTVKEISRKNLFYSPGTLIDQPDKFNDSDIIDEVEEFVVGEKEQKEMDEYFRNLKNKLKKDKEEQKERSERKIFTLTLEDKKCDIINDNNIKTIILKETVEELYINDCKNLESIVFNNNLKILEISHNYKLKNIILPESIKNFTTYNCQNIESVILNNNLEKIYIDYCKKLTNVVLTKNLLEINISHCDPLQNIDISELSVQKLRIIECDIESLVLNDNLLDLYLEWCKNLNNIVFPKNLSYLYISDCGFENINMISNNELEILIKHCNNLQKININNYNYISNISLMNLPLLQDKNINISCESKNNKLTKHVYLDKLNIRNTPKFNFQIESMDLKFTSIHKNSSIESPQNVKILNITTLSIDRINIKGGILEELKIESDDLQIVYFEESKHLSNINLMSPKLNYITGHLPDSIVDIYLKCKKLKSIPNIPTNIKTITCANCDNLVLPETNIQYQLIKNYF